MMSTAESVWEGSRPLVVVCQGADRWGWLMRIVTTVVVLCLFMAALSQPAGAKIGLMWPVLFHLFNSIGFAHILPVSLAFFSKLAPKAINSTVIGLYYLAFFMANKVVGSVGQLYSTWPTTTFWLLHVASACVGLLAFVIFKYTVMRRLGGLAGEVQPAT